MHPCLSRTTTSFDFFVVAGTPILELYSPFESVPKMDSFAKDSTDHILFENLPNYTGKWEEMSGLIKTIRY